MLALLARWRTRLPAKPSVYAYFTMLMLLNALAALGARRLPRARLTPVQLCTRGRSSSARQGWPSHASANFFCVRVCFFTNLIRCLPVRIKKLSPG